MDLKVGDRFVDETGEWEIASWAYTTVGGKMVHARVQKVGEPAVTEERTWGAYEDHGEAGMSDSERRWQHPWLRIQLLLRSMLGTRWDGQTWPTIKAELRKALEMRSLIQRAGWFH